VSISSLDKEYPREYISGVPQGTLTPEQLEALRRAPLGSMPNRLRLAFTLASRRQVDAVQVTGIAAANLSELVNGKYSAVTVETARKLAAFFGCAIEDLFPAKVA
jgi:DNA-binding Xre family transcriptional regulator